MITYGRVVHWLRWYRSLLNPNIIIALDAWDTETYANLPADISVYATLDARVAYFLSELSSHRLFVHSAAYSRARLRNTHTHAMTGMDPKPSNFTTIYWQTDGITYYAHTHTHTTLTHFNSYKSWHQNCEYFIVWCENARWWCRYESQKNTIIM